MSKATCPICGNVILPIDDVVSFKRRKAHRKCLNNIGIRASGQEKNKLNATKKTSIPPKLSVPVSEAEYKEKRAVVEYVEQLTQMKATAKIYKLLEDYCKKYKFTYVGMLRGLQYYYEALENTPEGDCIGIIPYIYDEAQEYMNRIDKAASFNDKVTAKELKEMYPKVKYTVKKKKESLDLIDISSIL